MKGAWHKCFVFAHKAFYMPANKKENEASKENTVRPLSDTIENAHAAGDGAIERDKDTVLAPKEEGKQESEKEDRSNNEAY